MKGKIQAEEARQQMAEQGMPEFMNILAEVAAGGDRAKMEKMMEMGELDTVKYLPLVFEALGKRAKPYIEEYYKTVQFARNKAARANEEYMKKFLEGGAAEGMNAVLKAYANVTEYASRFAGKLGEAFRRAGHLVAAALLIPKEAMQWFRGEADKDNIMQILFGDIENTKIPEIVLEITNTTRRLDESMKSLGTTFRLVSLESTKKEFEALGDIILQVVRYIQDYGAVFASLAAGNFKDAVAAQLIGVDRQESRRMAKDIAVKEGLSLEDRGVLEDQIFQALQEQRGDYWSLPMSELVRLQLAEVGKMESSRSGRVEGATEFVDNVGSPGKNLPESYRHNSDLVNWISEIGQGNKSKTNNGEIGIPMPAISFDELSPEDIERLSRPVGILGRNFQNKKSETENSPPRVFGIREDGGRMGLVVPNNPNNIPANTPNSAQGIQFRHYMEVKFTGDVNVSGSVEALTADLDFEEPFRALFTKELNSQLPQTNLLAK